MQDTYRRQAGRKGIERSSTNLISCLKMDPGTLYIVLGTWYIVPLKFLVIFTKPLQGMQQ